MSTLNIPESTSTVSLKAFNLIDDVNDVALPAALFFHPVVPGHEVYRCPVFAFLVTHAATGRRIMFDLGLRKDPENASPAVAQLAAAGNMKMNVRRDILEQLQTDGVEPETISAVVWSHAHYDHIGDMSKFPASTELVFGDAMSTDTYLENPASSLTPSDLAGRTLNRINFATSPLSIGAFKAHDYFGDGSFYLLSVPGHLPGHLCALARVSSAPNSFVLLGADTCHHAGMLRPTASLHALCPCPGALLSSARTSVSSEHFASNVDGGNSFAFDLAARNTPLLEVTNPGVHADPSAARLSIASLGTFDAHPDIFVMLAHDESLLDVVGPFPRVVDAWKEAGWKEKLTWEFVNEKNPAWRFGRKENN
ncbi:beta-lactamase-like protein [Mycena galopus ATCC 62051]|nr:beta-lactamase-like protein [Mycena galopus ATCC 62051]